MSQSRKYRGYRTERVVASYLQNWWENASVGRGAGRDIYGVPFDCEVKSRTGFQPLAWLKQQAKRNQGKALGFLVLRCNGQGEDAAAYLALMPFGELVELLLKAGYADIQTDADKLEPERCAQCGSWKLEDVPCQTCKVSNANL